MCHISLRRITGDPLTTIFCHHLCHSTMSCSAPVSWQPLFPAKSLPLDGSSKTRSASNTPEGSMTSQREQPPPLEMERGKRPAGIQRSHHRDNMLMALSAGRLHDFTSLVSITGYSRRCQVCNLNVATVEEIHRHRH